MLSTPRRRGFVFFVLGALAVALLILTLYAIFTTHELAERIRGSQRANVTTLRVIQDCTDADGKCFRKGQRRSADLVAGLNLHDVLVAVCIDHPGSQTQAQVDRCVARLTKRLGR